MSAHPAFVLYLVVIGFFGGFHLFRFLFAFNRSLFHLRQREKAIRLNDETEATPETREPRMGKDLAIAIASAIVFVFSIAAYSALVADLG